MPSRIATLQRLFDHLAWADVELGRALGVGDPNAEALREFAHIAGADEVWLSRIEGRAPAAKVWPALSRSEALALAAKATAGYQRILDAATESSLDEPVDYTNSAGQRFSTPLVDILLQVALHGQYHRGKVNLLLRQAGAEPAPTDFISFARGAPAAVTPR